MVLYKGEKIMTTVSQAKAIYWGEGGKYGPFAVQTAGEWAGWPDFGQVLRYFRKAAKLSKEEFAALYGKETKSDGSSISIRQVYRMELDNDVPTDMNRRKLIARLLNIPPMLFGLATLEEVILQPHPEKAGVSLATGYSTLPKVVADTSKYQSNIRTFLTLHYTSQAQSEFHKITADIRDLESLEAQTSGDLQYHIRELLFSYHILAAKVVRDQRKYPLSYEHANQAVRVAKETKDLDLIATALYTRGRTYLEWGMYGTLEKERGIFQGDRDKITRAIRDFEHARKLGKNTESLLHPQLLGFLDMQLSRAYAARSSSTGGASALAMTLLDQAEQYVDCENIDDPYERHLVTGELISFGKGVYHNGRAIRLVTLGRSGAAHRELTTLEGSREGAIGKQFTREQAWLEIIAADVYMGLEQFGEATKRAARGLTGCLDVNSVANLAIIVDLHGRLLQSPYKADPDVEELGDMIQEGLIRQNK